MISNSLFIISLTFLYFFTKPPEPKFEAQTIDDNIDIGYGLAIGDVNGDGKPDILLADKKQFVWYRNGDWKRFIMADSLTRHDNVCIAARDIDGDGKVEVAVGAQWNPGETSDIQESGSVYYLIRPDNPTQRWNAVKLYHEPTVHRMQWVKLSKGKYALVVLPLHGRGNKGGEGVGVKVLAYHFPENINALWKIDTLENTMHLTHNFDVVETQSATQLYLAGKEGIKLITLNGYHSSAQKPLFLPHLNNGAGEVRIGKGILGDPFIVTIEAMHGNKVVAYFNKAKKVLSRSS